MIDFNARIHYPEHWERYKAFPYAIMRCDFVRSCVLHRYGGAYVDLDVTPTLRHQAFSPLKLGLAVFRSTSHFGHDIEMEFGVGHILMFPIFPYQKIFSISSMLKTNISIASYTSTYSHFCIIQNILSAYFKTFMCYGFTY